MNKPSPLSCCSKQRTWDSDILLCSSLDWRPHHYNCKEWWKHEQNTWKRGRILKCIYNFNYTTVMKNFFGYSIFFLLFYNTQIWTNSSLIRPVSFYLSWQYILDFTYHLIQFLPITEFQMQHIELVISHIILTRFWVHIKKWAGFPERVIESCLMYLRFLWIYSNYSFKE